MYSRDSSLKYESNLNESVGGNAEAIRNLMLGRMQVTALLVLPKDDDCSLFTKAHV